MLEFLDSRKAPTSSSRSTQIRDTSDLLKRLFYVGGYSPNGHWIVYRKQGLNGQHTLYRTHADGSGKQRINGPSTILRRNLAWGPATS